MGNISNPEQWATRERLRFIERVVYWRGAVRREEVAQVFNLSAQQISADLQKYQELNPGALIYNLKKKTYEGSAGMKCRLHEPNFDEAVSMFIEDAGWDAEMMGKHRGARSPSSLLGRVELPRRVADPAVQRRIFLAVLNGQRLRIQYFSVHGAAEGGWRWICPRGFANDGYRWHVRAWCEKHDEYRDFVLSRVRAAEFPTAKDFPTLPPDREWDEWVTLRLKANPEFNQEKQAGLIEDFQLQEGPLELNVRKAMLDYTLEHLRLPGANWDPRPFLVLA